jgi:cytochrome c-type biogenesis protein CcmF
MNWIGVAAQAATWIAAGLAFAAAAAALPSLQARLPPRLRDAHRPLLFAATATAFALFVFLASRFLAADLAYQYVFFYTARDVEWPWRLAGTWAGREGSLLLWTLWLGLVASGMVAYHRRRPDEPSRLARHRTVALLALTFALFLVAVAAQSPFTPTSENLLQGRPDGNGLNPTLKSPFILIHPPMMFAAYALATVPLASALAHLATGSGKWSQVARPWARLGWLLMTFSLGLGALWAYYTLGFGGYWAWDPVEVANLLPWLGFTVYLHAALHHDRHGSYANVGPFLAALPFLLTLFSTISTRSGLWVSVHAFTDPTGTFNADAAARFLDILRVEPSLGFHVGLFLAVFAALLALWAHRLAADHGMLRRTARVTATLLAGFGAYAMLAPASAFSILLEASWQATRGRAVGLGLLGLTFAAVLAASLPLLVRRAEPGRSEKGLGRIHLRSLAGYAIFALGLALLMLFLFHTAAAQQGVTAKFYEARLPYLALPVTLGLVVFQGHQVLGRRRSLIVAGVALALGAAAWLLLRTQGDFRLAQGALLAVPAAVLGTVSLVRIQRAGAQPGTPKRVRRGRALLLVAALLDVLFWFNPPRVELGFWSWTPTWPAQAVLGGLAMLGLYGAVLVLCGRRLRWPFALVGALGGFYVAAPLALVAFLASRSAEAPRRGGDEGATRARLHQVALHGIHFAIALTLIGYATSTYAKQEADLELQTDDSADVAGFLVRYDAVAGDTQPGFPADRLEASFAVQPPSGNPATLQAPWTWQKTAGSHYPLPVTLRTWSGDFYVDVIALHVAPGAHCLGPTHSEGAWVQAYRAGSPSRICSGDAIDAVRLNAASLPGLGILWLALAVAVGSMALLMATGKRA